MFVRWLYVQFSLLHSLSDFSIIAKITKETNQKKLKEGEVEKPHSPATRSDIKQALRLKCNSVINICRKKVLLSLSIILGQCFVLKV